MTIIEFDEDTAENVLPVIDRPLVRPVEQPEPTAKRTVGWLMFGLLIAVQTIWLGLLGWGACELVL